MRLSIASDYRFNRTPDGAIWTDGPCHFRHWTRYLAVFDSVQVIARVRDVETRLPSWQQADGEEVAFAPLPHYLGPLEFVRVARRLRKAARQAVAPSDAVLLNMPGQIAGSVATGLRKDRPYGVQVLGDPQAVFAPGVVQHPLRPLFRWYCSKQQQRIAAQATASLYVTKASLQQLYPCAGRMVGVSDVDLATEAFREPPRPALPSGKITIVSVGVMSQLYKGFDVLLNALALLEELDLKLVLVGDGKYRGQLEAQANQLGLSSKVEFRGQLPTGPRVREELDAADLFILPSRTEGLPRALIEAMARRLPCLASRVGGIPELLASEDLVPAGDSRALAGEIRRVLRNPQRMSQMAERNFKRAMEYRAGTLQARRSEFFQHLADRTADWQRSLQSARSQASSIAPQVAPVLMEHSS